jgi:spermidine synthase
MTRGPSSGVRPALLVWFFLSGASALVYEVVWLRWLVHVFGASTLAVGTVLTAFMGGLAVGGWAGGALAARVKNPLAGYGVLELAIGVAALALPGLLGLVSPALIALGATETSSFALLTAVRFLLAVVVLGVPTFCMGATLPLLATAAAPARAEAGGRVGRLYAANVAGAVIGTAAAGLLLLPWVGAWRTNLLAALVNLGVGATALYVARARPGAPRARRGAPAGLVSPSTPGEAAWPRQAALGLVTLAGATALVYQVAWNRALGLVLGSSVYAFTVTLTTILVGLAVGSYLVARVVDRLRAPASALAVIQLASAATTFGALLAMAETPYLFARLFALTGGRHEAVVAAKFLLAGGLVLPTAVLAGTVFPLCVRLAAGGGEPIGRLVGQLYGLNSFGAILGSLAAAFLLVPQTGIHGTFRFALLLNLLCGAALLITLGGSRRLRAAGWAVPLVAAGLLWAAPRWQPLVMASGASVHARDFQRYSREQFRRVRAQPRLLFYQDGLTATVSVEQVGPTRSLHVDGKADASTARLDMPTQVLVGHLPLLFHPEPRQVLVIGLGSGVTLGSVLRHPIERLTVVELEPAVLRASRFFDGVSGAPLDDPRTRLVANDARNALLLTRDRFDVIISEPSNPWMSFASTLFTREFLELARSRLRPGGVFGQWLQIYTLAPDVVRTVVATFHAVFPHAVLFRVTGGDTVLIGSVEPFRLDRTRFLERLTAPPVRADFERIEVRSLGQILEGLLLDLDDVARFAAGAPLNTDDNGLVEFGAPRSLYLDSIPANLERLSAAQRDPGAVRRLLAPEAGG